VQSPTTPYGQKYINISVTADIGLCNKYIGHCRHNPYKLLLLVILAVPHQGVILVVTLRVLRIVTLILSYTAPVCGILGHNRVILYSLSKSVPLGLLSRSPYTCVKDFPLLF
jgi:hypothetical protein